MSYIFVIAAVACKWNFKMASNLQTMFRLIIFQLWLSFASIEELLCNINCNLDLKSAFHPLKSLVYLFWNNFGDSRKQLMTELSALLEWSRSLPPCWGTHTLEITPGKVPPPSTLEIISLIGDKKHLGRLRNTDLCTLSRPKKKQTDLFFSLCLMPPTSKLNEENTQNQTRKQSPYIDQLFL